MLAKLLEKFGLSANEVKAYTALVGSSSISVQDLSKASGIARTSLYGILENLLHQGLVSTEIKRGTTLYFANGAQAFARIVADERESLDEREKISTSLISLFPTLIGERSANVPRLQFVEGKKAVENLLYESIGLWRESYKRLDHFTMWGYQDHSFVDQYRKWHEFAWKSREPREEIKLFSNIEAVEQQRATKIQSREIRPLPEGFEFSSSIWIHGDYLLLGMTRKKPHYAFQIHDIALTANLRTVFQLLWKLTK